MSNDIQNLLDKYWAGETSLNEEAQLKKYMASADVSEEHQELTTLFDYFEEEKHTQYNFEPDLSFTTAKAETKVRYLLPKIVSVAAAFILLLTVAVGQFNNDDYIYKNKYTELEDPDEALAIAMDALGFLGHKYEKGSAPMTKYFKNIEKTAVFKFD